MTEKIIEKDIENAVSNENIDLQPYSSSYYSDGAKRWVRVRIVPRKVIGQGHFGTALLVDVPASRGRTLHFVVKRPHPVECSLSEYEAHFGIYEESVLRQRIRDEHAMTQVAQEIKNYELAKRAGLKVFDTMRQLWGDNGAELLMTTGFTDEWICLGDKGEAAEVTTYGLEKLTQIENFTKFVDEVFEQSEIAFHYGMTFNADAYFFLVNRQNPSNVNFVLGDVGCLEKDNHEAGFKSIWLSNLESAVRALRKFITLNVDPAFAEDYLAEVLQKSQAIINEKQLEKPEKIKRFFRDLRTAFSYDSHPTLTQMRESRKLVYR